MFILLLFFVWRPVGSQSVATRLTAPARDAAREASTWRSATDANNHGVLQGLSDLQGGHSSCRDPQITIDTSGLRPGGEIVATVSCTVALADISGLHAGPSRTMRARAVAVVDTFRSR